MKSARWAVVFGLLPAAAMCAEITVTGVGTVKAIPNQGELQVTCTQVGNKTQPLSEVKKANEACEKQYLSAARSIAGQDQVTIAPSFEKRFEYQEINGRSTRVEIGWAVTTRIEAVLPRPNGNVLAKDLAKLYDAADQAGAEVGTPVLGFTPETSRELRNKALGLATADAESVARAALPKDHELGELKTLSTTGSSRRPVPVPMAMAAAPRSARFESASPSVVEIGEQVIEHSIEAVYNFSKKLVD